MAYTIKLGTFSKLENSTAQPVMTSWAEYTVTFKEGADYSNPVLSIAADFSVLYAYNYAHMLGRYYWIADIQAVRSGYCSISLKVDVLATYKAAIGNTDLYVLRSSTAADGSIRDSFYPIKATAAKYRQTQGANTYPNGPFVRPPFFQYGFIVLYVAGINSTTGTTMYEMRPNEFKDLIAQLYTRINGIQLDDVIAEVVQYFGGNPQALINSAMWFPFAFQNNGLEYVKIGAWTSNVAGAVITDPVMAMPDCTFTLNKHPLAATRGSYLNLSPYTQYTVGVPGCGVVTLDGAKLQDQTSIVIRREMDALSGQMIAYIDAGQSGQRLATLNGTCGIPISLSGNNSAGNTIASAAGAIGSGIGAIASGGASAIAGAAISGINAAVDTVNNPGITTIAGGGGAAIMDVPCWLDTVCYDITDADNSQEGRPLCQIRKPSNIGGFIRVADGYVEISGPLPEQQEIKRFLESGFFYN